MIWKETMTAYLIVTLKFHHFEWANEYMLHVPKMVENYGGAYLARSKSIVQFEGDAAMPDQIVLLTFPSLDAIDRFLNSIAYKPFRTARMGATHSEIIAFDI